MQVRRNRLNTLGEVRNTAYVDLENVRAEVAATRQLFENQGWPAIDVSRRSVEETGGGGDEPARRAARGQAVTVLVLASSSASRASLLAKAGVPFEIMPAHVDEETVKESLLPTAPRSPPSPMRWPS